MEPQETHQQPVPATPAGRKILIIEDEHFISELYVRALTRAGYDVTVEVDGKRGMELAQANQYDIILLDLMVPTMTGTEILSKLRGPGAAPLKSKIIITTNLEQREENRGDIENLADAYLIKAEITPRELVAFLDNVA